MTFRCLSPYCKPSMIVMSQREDVHLYCPAFTSLLKLISLSRKDYCPALYILANSDITSGRMYCPALYILTNSDITRRILHCQGLMEFVFMLFYPGVDTSVTLFFSCWSLCVEFKHSLHGYFWLLLWFYSLLYIKYM